LLTEKSETRYVVFSRLVNLIISSMKATITILLTLFALFAFAAQDDEKPKKQSPLVGTWQQQVAKGPLFTEDLMTGKPKIDLSQLSPVNNLKIIGQDSVYFNVCVLSGNPGQQSYIYTSGSYRIEQPETSEAPGRYIEYTEKHISSDYVGRFLVSEFLFLDEDFNYVVLSYMPPNGARKVSEFWRRVEFQH
jgi:hypothetical protein